MLILLPPSEGKATPATGSPVDLSALAFAGPLGEARAALLAARPELLAAPAAPAAEVYTGVLYAHLRLGELPPAARRRAAERVLIASGLWGVVRPGDRIPAYKLPIDSKLAAHWREPLRAALPDDGLVVDLRSGAYAAAWRPRTARHVTVRAFAEAPDGSRKPISHMAKRVRGEVARILLSSRADLDDAAGVARVLRRAGLRVERAGGGLDVIEG